MCSVLAPLVRFVHDLKRNVFLLELNGTEPRQDVLMCQLMWDGMPGERLAWVSQNMHQYQCVSSEP